MFHFYNILPHFSLAVAMATAIPVPKFCDFFFLQKKGRKGKKFHCLNKANQLEQTAIRYRWVGGGNWTLVISPSLTKSHSFQTENVLLYFYQQIIIIVLTRICNGKR